LATKSRSGRRRRRHPSRARLGRSRTRAGGAPAAGGGAGSRPGGKKRPQGACSALTCARLLASWTYSTVLYRSFDTARPRSRRPLRHGRIRDSSRSFCGKSSRVSPPPPLPRPRHGLRPVAARPCGLGGPRLRGEGTLWVRVGSPPGRPRALQGGLPTRTQTVPSPRRHQVRPAPGGAGPHGESGDLCRALLSPVQRFAAHAPVKHH